jgi:ATP-dependent DNA ligase
MPKKVPAVSRKIGFIETMDCLPVSKLPEGAEWTYEIKLDGYRLEAVRNTKEVTLYSRRQNVLNDRFGYIATALEYLPSGTVIDGEVVGLRPNGHADFYLLQKFRSAQSNIVYYTFDILVHGHRDLTILDT